jgi:hypothetical protein
MMSYWAIAVMSADPALKLRVSACAAQEGIPDPRRWATDNLPLISADSDWAEAWTSAVERGEENPGSDCSVITDEAIRTAVRAHKAA